MRDDDENDDDDDDDDDSGGGDDEVSGANNNEGALKRICSLRWQWEDELNSLSLDLIGTQRMELVFHVYSCLLLIQTVTDCQQ